MIINFNIKNFGPIKSQQTLSFEAEKTKHLEDFYVTKIKKLRLLKIALIYGANASGKTTVLKALDLLRELVLEPVNKKTDKLDFQPFLFDKDTPEENSVLSIEFLQNEVKYYYELEFNKKAVTKEILKFSNPNRATVFNRTTDLDDQLTTIKFGSKFTINSTALKTLEANTLWNNTVLGGYLKTNVEIKELKEVSDWFENYLQPVIYPTSKLAGLTTSLVDTNKIKKEYILTILRKADLNISDILIEKKEVDISKFLWRFLENADEIPDDKLDELKTKKKYTTVEHSLEHSINGEKYSLKFELESAGTKRFYGFASVLSLLIKEQIIFPIDELGASLHPDLYQYFLLMFLANSSHSQIIATTHNREILNDNDLLRDDAIWITDKSKNASTELYSFSDFDSSIIRDTTNRLNAYKSGKLGGIPNISDYYLDLE